MVARTCTGTTPDGRPCRAWPLRDESSCLFHSTERADEVAEGRRLGGLRRRRERTLASAYDLESLTTVAALRRLLEIAALDTLGLENSVARSRTLVAVVAAGSRLLEVGELEARLTALEAALTHEAGVGREASLIDGPSTSLTSAER
ncbi:MAG: hypothetical protein ACC726_12240 [Chloroflexota bacterium]